MAIDIEIPPKFSVLFPREFQGNYTPSPFKTMLGGRGGMKSKQTAKAFVLHAYVKPNYRFLCAREFMSSMRDSVIGDIGWAINDLGLGSFFEVGNTEVVGRNGSQFLFKGLRVNPESIKSIGDINFTWIEEAATVSRESLKILLPTVARTRGSEVWFTYNPRNDEDPVHKDYYTDWPKDDKRNIIIVSGWQDCKDMGWLSQEMEDLKDRDYARDFDEAQWIWGGECRKLREGAIFADKCVVADFSPGSDWIGPFFGADFGFVDPTVFIKSWITPDGSLAVEDAQYRVGCDTPMLPGEWLKVPGWYRYRQDPSTGKFTSNTVALDNVKIRCDCARADTIAELNKFGVPAIACEKWKGDFISDGIAAFRGFNKIVIHSRCRPRNEKDKHNFWYEAQNYQWEIDKAGAVLSKPRDKYNHGWDALRYAMQPIIQSVERQQIVIYDSLADSGVSIAPELDRVDELSVPSFAVLNNIGSW